MHAVRSGVSSRGGGGGEALLPPQKEKEREKEREREGDRREVREQHIFGYYIIRKELSN